MVFVCVSSTYVIRLCVGNDAVYLIVAVGYVTLVFLKAVKTRKMGDTCQNSTICVDAYQCVWYVCFFAFDGVLRMNVKRYSMKTFRRIPLP